MQRYLILSGRAEGTNTTSLSPTQVQRKNCHMKATNKKLGSEKENKDSCGHQQLFSPPPSKKNSEVSAPKKKDKRLLRTLPLSSHMNNVNHPMKYYHKTPSSSEPSSLTNTELLPCTPLLEFKSKKEYLATPRVLFDHCNKDFTAAATVKMS